MRLTFIHDHKFISEGGEYYSSGKFSSKILSRYMVDPIDEIQFIGRIQKRTDELKNLVRTSTPAIKVNPMLFLKKKSDFILKKFEIKNFLERNIKKTDIVIIRLPSELGYVAAEYLSKNKIPYGIELVGDPWDALWYHGSFAGKLMAFINKHKVRKYMHKSKHNIYVTKEYLQKKYPSENYFIASNVLVDKVINNYKNENTKIKKIGMIGSLDTKYKGIDIALKSLKLIDQEFSFEIVGNGPKEEWEERIIKYNLQGKVNLLGTLKSGEEINNWLSTLDLYLQPSLTEGLPRALIEAMSNGIPALGSTAGGIPELLNNKYLHSIKDYKILAKQINLVLSNEKLRDRMSKENLKTAKTYLNKNIQIEREKFIKSILRESQI
jgi:glycosyltransferase involved in cell wall biosynthesis